MQSAATLPEAAEIVERFRTATLARVVERVTGRTEPRPALRTALRGWLGYVDAVLLDWVARRDLDRAQVRDLILAAFGASLLAAQQLDPGVALTLA